MNFKEMIDNMSPEVYASLKQAVELGKWPNGIKLTTEQKELCMQAVITYDYTNKEETDRVGYIDTQVHDACDSKTATNDHETIKWVDGPKASN